MRTLSSTLLQAQKNPSSTPYVKVEVLDKIGGIARLRFNRHYSGAEVDYFHAATMPSDGSLVRARIDSTGGYQLYIQRVASPSPTSNFGTWTALTSVSNSGDVALCSQGTTALLFYISTNQQSIYVRESGDSGQTFGSPALITTAPSPVTWMAAGVKSDGTAVLLYLIGAADLYAVKRTGGAWGAPQLWSNALASVNGVGVTYYQDWNVMVAGKEYSTNRPGVWTTIYGDGYAQAVGTWSSLMNLVIAEDGSGIIFSAPFMERPDVFRAMFIEQYSGAQTYKTPFFTYSMPSATYANNLWREPVPFELTSQYGVALAFKTGAVWLSTPYGVWSASLGTPALDLTQDVLRSISSLSPTTGGCEVELQNENGKYNALGSGSLELLQRGSEVQISLGYKTSVGNEVSTGETYWIDDFQHHRGKGGCTLVLHAVDGWGLLKRWKARRQFAWGAGQKNISGLVAFLLARAGLDFQPGATSSPMIGHYPAFTIHPDESADIALKRLLQMVQDLLVFFSGGCKSVNPLATDSSTYSYGSSHSILEGRYYSPAPQVNRVQVFGAGVFSESYNWTDIPAVYDRLNQVQDLNLDSSQKASDRTSREMRHEAIGMRRGAVVVPANAGQELYDVIDITDSSVGLSAAKRRITGVRTSYAATGPSPRYTQTLYLGDA